MTDPWLFAAIASAGSGAAAWVLMGWTLALRERQLAARTRGGTVVQGLLQAVVWPVVACGPWLLAIANGSTKRMLETSDLFPPALLALHVLAAVPAYRRYRRALPDLLASGADPVSVWPGEVPRAAALARSRTPVRLASGADRGEESEAARAWVERLYRAGHLPLSAELRVTVRGPIAAGVPVASAHRNWRAEAAARAKPLEPFARTAADSPCPPGLVLLEIECVRRVTGGMSSYYGFEGAFVSMLGDLQNGVAFDVRAEEAR